MSKMQELSAELNNLAEAINNEFKQLTSDHSKTEKELVDIYHYIEFNDLSASAGYQAYKDLQTCLKHRREVKNDIELANTLLGATTIAESAERVEKSIDTRMYSPRVREDLFPTPSSKAKFIGNILAEGRGKKFVFVSLEEAIQLVVSTKGPDFAYSKDKIGAKILKAARTGKKYDGWNWNLE